MFNINLDKYFDALETVQMINNKNFEDLDLSEFFTNADTEVKLKIKEKYTKLNNFNKIYVLVAYENVREEFGILLKEPEE